MRSPMVLLGEGVGGGAVDVVVVGAVVGAHVIGEVGVSAVAVIELVLIYFIDEGLRLEFGGGFAVGCSIGGCLEVVFVEIYATKNPGI